MEVARSQRLKLPPRESGDLVVLARALLLIAFTHDEKGTQIGMEVPKRCANALKHGAGASRSKVNARNSMLLPVPGSPITRQGPSLDAIHSIAGLR